MSDWLLWILGVGTLVWVWRWLTRPSPPDTIERFKHWRP
jgi:hypothetical protein